MLTLFAVVAVVELVAVALGWTALQWVAKPLLAPLLAGYALRRGRPDLVTAALAFATAGDIALLVDDDLAFLVGMGFFLGTQVCLIVAFAPWARPRPFVGYAVVWVVANVLLWDRLGDLAVPVAVYSLALSAMAATAAGVSRRTAAGGALFLVSDLLIGLGAADAGFPGRDVLVMATYSAALYLIVTGWVGRTNVRTRTF
ncbi:lysoplasmalogenase [Cryptosporangium phraense]|uniref:Lysoplasmalogenase n=1 Tax=Cryptosporangium phraense TaxID=2593070 RepID=A0A545ARG4_9ACTN|nr:lysoplasmalogenase [Cryptosporangium phraense]TQS43918.1 lysoplasmalogenase [Cryptosporangium phraense]